jgi:hypothetical protein
MLVTKPRVYVTLSYVLGCRLAREFGKAEPARGEDEDDDGDDGSFMAN